jgi:hypothetical protein
LQPLFQLSTRNYEKEIPLVKKAMEALEQTCKVKNGYELFDPFTRVGWSFFNLQISEEMFFVIEKSGMMDGAMGYRISEQIKNFLGHYLESHGSQVRIKNIEY